jgi:hypothetical protein
MNKIPIKMRKRAHANDIYLETTHGSVVTETIPEGTILNPEAHYIYNYKKGNSSFFL